MHSGTFATEVSVRLTQFKRESASDNSMFDRTSNRGLYNVLLLLAAGVCFGSVSTFSMHFIGNNSLTLHHPQEVELNKRPFSLTYEAGWTVLSLVVSCVVTILAFFVMGLEGEYIHDAFRKIGLARPKSEDGSTSEEEDEDIPEARNAAVVTDLSLKEKKPSKKRIWNKTVGNHPIKVADKLKTVLGPSRHDAHELADLKSQTTEKELGRDESHKAAIPVVIKPPPSDPVASGYDNPPVDPTSIDPFNLEPYDPTLRRASVASIQADILPEVGSISNAESGRESIAPDAAPIWQSREDPQLRSAGHRASLPHIFPPPSIVREHPRPTTNLSRIQSLPESYPDDTLSKGVTSETMDDRSRATQQRHIDGSVAEIRRRTSQTSHISNDKKAGEDEDRRSIQESPASSETYSKLHNKRHRNRQRKREGARPSRLRRRLGLDVVTVEDVVKIFFSGAIAGIGIAGMRESFQKTLLMYAKVVSICRLYWSGIHQQYRADPLFNEYNCG